MTTPDPTTDKGAWALDHLAADRIVWLTTVDPDGQPQSSPVWFLWRDDEFLIYSHKRAVRNGNLADRTLVAISLNTDESGDHVATAEGTARFDPDAPLASADPVYMAKYGPVIDGYGWTPEQFAADYPVAIRIAPTRWRLG